MFNKIKNIVYKAFPTYTIRDGRPLTDLLIKPSAAINEQFEVEKASLLEKMYLGNYDRMTYDEMDLLTSNFLFTKRRIGRFSSGMVRIYLNTKTDIVFDRNKSVFETAAGDQFIPRYDYGISSDTLSFDQNSGFFYADILVISLDAFGGESLISAGQITKYVGSNPFVQNVTNINDFVLVDIVESNTDYYNRIMTNGILLNQTRNNYLGNLLYQTFPDIQKYTLSGVGHNLMQRDLVFDKSVAETAIKEYTFFKKKRGSTIDNKSIAWKGLLNDNNLENLDYPNFLTLSMSELKQDEYESIAFLDNSSAEVSSLISDDLFALFAGGADLLENKWTYTENNISWNRGSSYVNFTGSFDKGIEIRGNYNDNINEINLTNDSGVVFYKEFTQDVRDTEFLLSFQIQDFVNTDETGKKTTVSNNNPLYFTIMKKGVLENPNIKGSVYDGYGVVIHKSFSDGRPNVFLVDGSSAVGDQIYEEQILNLGSERILAAKQIPLNAGQVYYCIMQVNANYGMKVTFRDEYNTELGYLLVGSGADLPEFLTTYSLNNRIEVKTDDDVEPVEVSGTKYRPIKFDLGESTNNILNILFSVAKGTDNYKLKNFGTSRRILILDNNSSSPNAFFDFSKTVIGDVIEINEIKYFIINKYSNKKIEIDQDISLNEGTKNWIVKRGLRYNIDYRKPISPIYSTFTLLAAGYEELDNVVNNTAIPNGLDGNLTSDVKFYVSFLTETGIIKESEISWNKIKIFKQFQAQTDPDVINLLNVNLINKELDPVYDYFYSNDVNIYNKFSSVYLTQMGFNKLISDKFNIKITPVPGVPTNKYLNKVDFTAGYQLSLQYPAGINQITDIKTVTLASSGFNFTKDIHYSIFNAPYTDILVNAASYPLFNGNINITAEVIGSTNDELDEYSEFSRLASSTGNNKLYVDNTGIGTTILDAHNQRNFISILINGVRYYILNISQINPTVFGKNICITVDKNLPLLNNETCILRKKCELTSNANKMKFGYRYDLEELFNSSLTVVDIFYGDKLLTQGEDYEWDRKTPCLHYFISSEIYNTYINNTENKLLFNTEYREVLIEERYGKGYQFKPLSSGSYVGIGVRSVTNSAWNILQFSIRKLLEKYSAFLIKTDFSDKLLTSSDRLKININTYAINSSATSPINGVSLLVYNFNNARWEKIIENDAISSADGQIFLKYYDGEDLNETNKYKFGYYDGIEFISVNDNFYLPNYCSAIGEMYYLLISRGKNEKDFSGSLLFGEANLFLEYFNIMVQRNSGIHTGNKIDIWTASQYGVATGITTILMKDPFRSISIDSQFKKPIKIIKSVKILPQNVEVGFVLNNNSPNYRFTTKEDLSIYFDTIMPPGTYEIEYEYYPHLAVKQEYIDSLQFHIDCLVRQFVPVDISINLGYQGTLNDENSVKNLIIQYVRFNNIVDSEMISQILLNNGAISTFNLSDKPVLTITEYDVELLPQQKELNFNYQIPENKYFEISLNNINLVKS